MFAFLNLPKPRCVTCLLIQIYCPTFFSSEWVVICSVLPKINVLPISRPQIHVLCRNKSFKDVSCFCYSLGDELNAAFKRCNYRERDFLLKIARTSSTIEPDNAITEREISEVCFPPLRHGNASIPVYFFRCLSSSIGLV